MYMQLRAGLIIRQTKHVLRAPSVKGAPQKFGVGHQKARGHKKVLFIVKLNIVIVIKFNRTFSGDQTTKSIHFLLTDSDSDEFEMAVARYKPDRIESLCRTTKFNKKELQLMYRGFKQIEFDIDDMVIKFQECPAGLVDEETFKGIYAQFFPQGDSNQYAHYIFRSFDHNKTGTINFEEFVAGLSILTRGHLQEKLKWAFNLYDLDGDGCITKDEMYSVISSVYELMGDVTQPVYEADELSEHVDRVFQKLDANKDGILTIEEFVDSLSKTMNTLSVFPSSVIFSKQWKIQATISDFNPNFTLVAFVSLFHNQKINWTITLLA
ncbi:Calsenilin [Nymphon striatum]|nr:Calsenilin [Nymphon striatum]